MTLSPEIQQMLAEQAARAAATREEVAAAPLADYLDMYRSAVSAGGKSGHFLGTAFLSWYSGGPYQCSLGAWEELDAHNQALFLRMLTLRSVDGWTDAPLWALAKYCRAELGVV